jgi:hypothetical protein
MKPEEMNDEVGRDHLSNGDLRAIGEIRKRGAEGAMPDSGFPCKICPEPVGFAQLVPLEIRILILVDGAITFGNEGFGLSLFIDALDFSSPFIRFDIKKASRNTFDDTADYPGFSFERDFNPDRFQEVWLFGSESDLSKKLPENELKILAQFMNSGGGVFATGDHMAMGAALCGEVPRVRYMRKWFFADPLPAGQPRATSVDDEFRHDTLNKGHNSDYEYLDQVDDVPQMIFPKMYTRSGSTSCLRADPHSVLAYGLEAIRFLPDHVHEGECYVPENLSLEDFPAESGKENERVMPEVIAWAQIPDPHITKNFAQCFPTGQVATFGVIGAYDGQRIGLGRVVVDSSFHHFVNFNLCGFVNSQDKQSKDKGRDAYEQIKAYFRNLGIWLARIDTHHKVSARALTVSLLTYPLIEEILSRKAEINSKTLKLRDYYSLGTAARSTLGSLTSPPLVWDWSFSLFQNLLPKNKHSLFQDILQSGILDTASLLFGINVEVVLDILLGALVAHLTRNFDDDRKASLDVTDTVLNEMIAAGALDAMRLFLEFFNRFASELNSSAQAFSQEIE